MERLRWSPDITWHQNGDGRLHGFADDVVQGKHPVRLDVMVAQDFVYLETSKATSKPINQSVHPYNTNTCTCMHTPTHVQSCERTHAYMQAKAHT